MTHHALHSRDGRFIYASNRVILCPVSPVPCNYTRARARAGGRTRQLPCLSRKPCLSRITYLIHTSHVQVKDAEGHIVVFAVDGATGELSLVAHEPCGGITPRNFGACTAVRAMRATLTDAAAGAACEA